jgi:hypothetical protein
LDFCTLLRLLIEVRHSHMFLAGIQEMSGWTPINPLGGDDFENESRIIFDTPQLAAIVQVVPSGPQSKP